MIFFLLAGLTNALAAGKDQGIIREYDMHNKLRAEYSYKNGRLEGYCREYYENGRVASQKHYKDGKRDGLSRLYSENGRLEMESIYEAGRFISGREFDKKGRPLEGVVEERYPDGSLFVEANYKDGERHGPTLVYYEDGTLRTESVYQQGRLVSEREFAEDGKLISEEKYQ
jgi:antitoxin component YwqK of YwqJK toxin-antitoxin module